MKLSSSRLARLMAENMSSEHKLRDRIDYLERKLAKYDGKIRDQNKEDKWRNGDGVDEERQRLLVRVSD